MGFTIELKAQFGGLAKRALEPTVATDSTVSQHVRQSSTQTG